ncbi:MAG: RbsD/FucU family protein [Marinibacterium sp.]
MLIGLDARMTPDLLYALARMGHGDEIVVADANFPAASTARHCQMDRPIDLTNMTAPAAIGLICTLLPLDAFVPEGALRMEVDGAPDQVDEVHAEAWAVVNANNPDGAGLGSIERQAFYARARGAFAVAHTAEARPFGCFILRKGVVF